MFVADAHCDALSRMALLDLLARRGYSQQQLQNIAGMNCWRNLKAAEREVG